MEEVFTFHGGPLHGQRHEVPRSVVSMGRMHVIVKDAARGRGKGTYELDRESRSAVFEPTRVTSSIQVRSDTTQAWDDVALMMSQIAIDLASVGAVTDTLRLYVKPHWALPGLLTVSGEALVPSDYKQESERNAHV